MKGSHRFSFQRLSGIIAKEFTQMRRDRLTFAMMLGIPLIQLTLFGFAINSDPRHLPAAVLLADQGPQGRTLLYAISLEPLFDTALQNDLKGTLASLSATNGPIDLRVHALYNPEVVTQYNIVPGLMGVILTMTMVMITGLAITRERERGTMENLLAMPTRPSEVLIGKIVPYIFVGYIQVSVILIAAYFLFHVPMQGSIVLLLLVALVFIVANLAMGITFSTIAKNQLQAVQMAFFVFLPSILLSGFMFPFRVGHRNKTLPADTGLRERKGTAGEAVCDRSDWSDRPGDCSASSRSKSSCNRICAFT